MPSRPTSALRLALVVPALAVSALTGCGLTDGITSAFTTNVEDRFYDYADFSENAEFGDTADEAFTHADWMPADATTIGVRYFTEKPGATLSFSSEIGVESADCETGDLTGAPPLESSWWPSDEPAEGMVCGDWQVFGAGGTWYAWTN